MFDVLIIGCGYVGLRAAKAWISQGRSVAALTRDRAEFLAGQGIMPIVGNVLDAASLRALPRAHVVLHAVGFDRNAGVGRREVYVEGLRNVLAASRMAAVAMDSQQMESVGGASASHSLPLSPRAGRGEPQRFIHIGSTGVYAQTDGSWVDEDSPKQPTEDSGRIVLEAETLLRELHPVATILRFAGIYGPGRILRKHALLNSEPLAGDADKYLNLIHVDDGVAAILAAVDAPAGLTLDIADDAPPTRREFYSLTAQLLKAPPARFTPPPPGLVEPNRRIRNDLAKRVLNWRPRYSSCHQGLPAALAAPDS